jgi:hypothetical protein
MRSIIALSSIVVLVSTVHLFAHAADTLAPANGRVILDLSGQRWQMEGIRPGQGEREGFHRFFGEVCPSTFNWNGAEVPGDVYTDLWRAGEIDDPMVVLTAWLCA